LESVRVLRAHRRASLGPYRGRRGSLRASARRPAPHARADRGRAAPTERARVRRRRAGRHRRHADADRCPQLATTERPRRGWSHRRRGVTPVGDFEPLIFTRRQLSARPTLKDIALRSNGGVPDGPVFEIAAGTRMIRTFLMVETTWSYRD